ncbi:MAG: histidine--tRNA ligase [Christensenellales bacterium]
MITKAPKGTKDMLPKESHKWHAAEALIRQICAENCCREIRTPVFEHTELFLRSVGDTTDVVQKEMYTFMDKGSRSITLKPEGTAGTVRAYLEHGLFNEAQPTRMYYLSTPVFRYENPQSGRLREHHQFGIEIFGAPDASCDAEVIQIAMTLFHRLGVGGLCADINSIGCPDCRPAYNKALKEYFQPRLGEMCATCRERFDKNPLRILDCKSPVCHDIVLGAPSMAQFLCQGCKDHFEELKHYLEALAIPYRINASLVRGLDYYTKTVFEIISTGIGAQGTVCGGGRYDGLVESVGGPSVPGVGFGLGIERLLMLLDSQHIELPEPELCTVYLCDGGGSTKIAAIRLAKEIRSLGVSCAMDHNSRSMKAQFKYADKLGARFVAVIGEEEWEKKTVTCKDMRDGTQCTMSWDEAAQAIASLASGRAQE